MAVLVDKCGLPCHERNALVRTFDGWMKPFVSTTNTGDCHCSGLAALSALRVATALVIDTSVVASLGDHGDHSDRIMRQTPRATTNSSKPVSLLCAGWMHARSQIFGDLPAGGLSVRVSRGNPMCACMANVSRSETNTMHMQTHARWELLRRRNHLLCA